MKKPISPIPVSQFNYNCMKKRCNNEVHQFKRPAPWDDKKEVNGAHWIFSEEYALTHDGFELFWHTVKSFCTIMHSA